MLGLILSIQSVIALVQRGLTTANAVANVMRAGMMVVQDGNGERLSATEVIAAVEKALGVAAHTGDAAADRIENRPRGDGTGEP